MIRVQYGNWSKFSLSSTCSLSLFLVAMSFLISSPFRLCAQQFEVLPTNISVTAGMWQDAESVPMQISVTNAAKPQWYWYQVTNSWLSVSPSNGVSAEVAGTATMHFATANLDAGVYHTDVYVVSPLCDEVKRRIAVTLNVTNNPAVAQGVRVAPGIAGSPAILSVPIQLISTGDVNGISFSLSFNKTHFSSPLAALGSGVPFGSGVLLTNTSQARTFGRVGVAVTLGAGVAFAAGTVEVAVVQFTVSQKAPPTVFPFGFLDQPIACGIANTAASYLQAKWPVGNIMLVAGIEGDVAPRASNDWEVTAADVAQIGRFAAGLDAITSPGEFQKADIAPLGLLGDAAVSVIDWVQAGLYAAGLTPSNQAGGPYFPLAGTLPSTSLRSTAGGRAASTCLEGVEFTASRGDACTLRIQLQSRGSENAIGFSLGFDPGLLQFLDIRPANIPAGAGFLINSKKAGQGELGVLLALPPGTKMPATNMALLDVDFFAVSGQDPARTSIIFTDTPVRREVASVAAKTLPAAFDDAADVVLLPGDWDPAPPKANISTIAPDPLRVAPVPVSVSFSKSVFGFGAQSIALGNARVGNFSGSGRNFAFELYPINRGRLTAQIPAGVATDFLGEPNTQSALFAHRVGAAASDADGDGCADFLIYDQATGCWYVRGANGIVLSFGQAWGGAGFTPVIGDYDGDGLADLAVYQAATGLWFARSLAGTTLLWAEPWGGAGLSPVAGDYDGDMIADLAVYDRVSGAWFIRSVEGQLLAWEKFWGGAGMDPVSGDYNGDLVSDLALFAPGPGLWYAMSLDDQVLLWAEPWGAPGMVAVPGDYDGDGCADMAVYAEAAGAWYIKSSASGSTLAWADLWGGAGFAAVSGDFNGDGLADQAVYNRETGAWYVKTLGGAVVFWAEAWGGKGLTPCSE